VLRGLRTRDLRELGEHRVAGAPDLDGVNVGVDDVFEVGGQGRAVRGGAGARKAHAVCDIEDDAGEAVLVKVDLLMVWHLADGTWTVSLGARGGVVAWPYLTSAKLEGRSTMRAPPKSGVLRNVGMMRGSGFENRGLFSSFFSEV
jgi:hypothetical protein